MDTVCDYMDKCQKGERIMNRIALISCSKSKEDKKCTAVEMYSKSPAFRLSYELAKLKADQIFILSAKYGLLGVDDEIEPYDETLADKTKQERKLWSDKVLNDLKLRVSLTDDQFIILAGQKYYAHLLAEISAYWLPLHGLRQGERLKTLNRLLALEQEQDYCKELHLLFNSIPRMDYRMIQDIPFANGIYIMFEEGESLYGTDRIVRIGTHTGADNLRSRLNSHYLVPNRHRSIFRKNIGRTILHKEEDPYLDVWNRNQNDPANLDPTNIEHQNKTETAVREYLQQRITYVCIPEIEKKTRLRLEKGMISTLHNSPEFGPGREWMGNHSPISAIRESGLWQTQGLRAVPLNQEEYQLIKDKVHSDVYMERMDRLNLNSERKASCLPEKASNIAKMSVVEIREYILDQLEINRKVGETETIIKAGDIKRTLSLGNQTPSICNAMTKKIPYDYEILFAPPKGKSTRLTVRYFLMP
jgi:hypothetical protein